MNTHDFDTLKQRLPEFPGILGGDQYVHSAVLIPFLLQHGEYHLLFQKRTAHIRQGGEICFPGGVYDPELDATYKDTAIRETMEELGIARENIHIEGLLDVMVAPIGALVNPFIGRLDLQHLGELHAAPDEVENVFTIPVSFFEQTTPEVYWVRLEAHSSYIDEHGVNHILLPVEELGLPRRYLTPWGGRRSRVFVYKTPHGIIWGITAAMVYDVIQKLHHAPLPSR